MLETPFVEHTLDSAPAAARPRMEATTRRLGFLPSAVARLAESPQLLDGFFEASALFEATTLDPAAREVVVLTIATRNSCHVCVAMHTAKLLRLGADEEIVTALREQRDLPDSRLAALRVFTLRVLETAGAVGAGTVGEFLSHGYTARNALEVVLGIGAYTMSTMANRLTGAGLDEPLAEFAWHG